VTRPSPPPWSVEDIGACFVVKTPTRRKLNSTVQFLLFLLFRVPLFCLRDLEVPEVRLSKAMTARHRFDFELLLPIPGFCPSGLQFSLGILQGLQFNVLCFAVNLRVPQLSDPEY
jgi:hypothetical protein